VSRGRAANNRTDLGQISNALGLKLGVVFDRVFRAQSIQFYQLLGVTLFLVGFGVVMVLSASSIDSLKSNNNAFSVFGRQFAAAGVSLVLMSIVSLLPMARIRTLSFMAAVAALGLQLLVPLIGVSVNGNKNWIAVPLIGNIQPSEFLKVATLLLLANYLSSQKDYFYDRSVWIRALVIALVSMGSVMAGFDLGTVIIMACIFLGMMIMAGMPQKLINLLIVAAVMVVPAVLSFGSSSRVGRIMAWLNPSAPDPNGYNWQSEHGMWALSAGGVFGAGLGESKMKWSWIPEVENDFIFAIIGEELGLVGALVVIGLFVALFVFCLNILNRTSDHFSRYVVLGVTLWITLQAFVNIAVVLRLLPVLGVPLPLISAGGSSLLSTLVGIGLLLAIERQNHQELQGGSRLRAKPVRARR
jgi:cell division protein FtsW